MKDNAQFVNAEWGNSSPRMNAGAFLPFLHSALRIQHLAFSLVTSFPRFLAFLPGKIYTISFHWSFELAWVLPTEVGHPATFVKAHV